MINKRRKIYLVWALCLFPVLMLTSCYHLFLPPQGTLALYLADLPVNEIKHIYVTLAAVEVHKQDEGWQTVNDFAAEGGEATFDLLTLRFDEELLGQTLLPAGDYDKIRLVVAAKEDEQPGYDKGKSYVVMEDGDEMPIFIPAGTQRGLQINYKFTIETDTITRLILDVDIREMVNITGNNRILLCPTVIKTISKDNTGNIWGQVLSLTTQAPITSTDVLSTAYCEEGHKIATAIASTEDMGNHPAGSFKIRGLEPGVYDLEIKAEGFKTEVVTGVEVAAGSDTDVGVIYLETE